MTNVSVSHWPLRNTDHPENCQTKTRDESTGGAAQFVSQRTYEADDDAHDKGVPRSVRLQEVRVRERGTIEALDLEALVEADVGHANTEPGHQPGDGGHYDHDLSVI